MSLFLESKQQSYRSQRAASQGAGITLVCGAGEYTALFDCARSVALVLGDRELKDLGDGINEVIPSFKIPTEELNLALEKICLRFSVALVDFVCEKDTSRFVLLWKIVPSRVQAATVQPVSTNLDDY